MQIQSTSTPISAAKQPYVKPELQVHGAVVKTTLGNSQVVAPN